MDITQFLINRHFTIHQTLSLIDNNAKQIAILVDDENKLISIIDGHHRIHKAIKKGLKTIKAKLIPINSLPKKFQKVFKHLK